MIIGFLYLREGGGCVKAKEGLVLGVVGYSDAGYAQLRLHGMSPKVGLECVEPTVFMVPQHPCQLGKLFFAIDNGPRLASPKGLAQVCLYLSNVTRERLDILRH